MITTWLVTYKIYDIYCDPSGRTVTREIILSDGETPVEWFKENQGYDHVSALIGFWKVEEK